MTISHKAKVGVLCGGISSEREISLKSGENCFNALVRKGYTNCYLIDIKSAKDMFDLKEKIDIAFLITHGKYGEDGCIQGILEWLNIPYTGSSPTASAVAMDKWLTKHIARSLKISTASSYLLDAENTKHLNKIWKELSAKNGAVFLKPISDGSSVNIVKLKNVNEFEKIVKELDFGFNIQRPDFFAEEFIKGREITVSIIEESNRLNILPILELVPKNEFYDYEAKYTKGLTKFILPAVIEKNIQSKIEKQSELIFSEIGLSGFARIDYILEPNGDACLLEINSLPGMTDLSDLPAQAKEAGINYDDLVEIILKTARLHNYIPSRVSEFGNVWLKK